MSTLKCLVLGLFFLISSLAMVPSIYRECTLSLQSFGWPSVDGVVTESAIQGSGRSRWWQLRYSYEVHGQHLENNKYRFGFFEAINVSEFPVGSPVKVFYRPADPRVSVLKPGFGWNVAFLIVFFAIALVIGTALLTHGIRKKYFRGRPTND